jgi:nucleoside-triphosphatase THEP1
MKALLTGSPEVGKTTLLKDLRGVSKGAFWVIAERTFGPDGEKTGFKAVTSTGLMGQFSTRSKEGTHTVDEAAVARLYSDPIAQALKDGTHLLIIDEIGSLQCRASGFKPVIDRVFESTAVVVAVSPLGAEWTKTYAHSPSAFPLTLTVENRDQVAEVLGAMVASSRMLKRLSLADSQALTTLAKGYAGHDGFNELIKLFKNTVTYLSEHRYAKVSDGLYSVTGLTRRHQVAHSDSGWTCDCDLFEGRGQYSQHPGECSHIQTIKVAFRLS